MAEDWKSDAMRARVVQQIENAMKHSSNTGGRCPRDFENHVSNSCRSSDFSMRHSLQGIFLFTIYWIIYTYLVLIFMYGPSYKYIYM